MPFNLATVALLIFFVWLTLLTFFLWQMISHYNNLTKGSTNKTLKTVLDELVSRINISEKDIAHLKNRCDTIEKDGLLHIQKIGLLRFNPFKDTGGDQSFILALLDGRDTGVVVSGLYSRSGTRWYSKKISKGQGVEHELSDEEKKAIKEAKSF